jgi:hypothetical protein
METLQIISIIVSIGSAFLLFATYNKWLYFRTFEYKKYKIYKFVLKNINDCKYDFSLNGVDYFLLYDDYALITYNNDNSVGILKRINNKWECVFSSFFKKEAKELYYKLLEIKLKEIELKELIKNICVKKCFIQNEYDKVMHTIVDRK